MPFPTLLPRLAWMLLLAIPFSIGLASGKPEPRPDPRIDAEKQADMARFQILERSGPWQPAAASKPSAAEADPVDTLRSHAQPLGVPGNLGVRHGDLDRHFGHSAAGYPGRTTAAFDIGADLADAAFGVMVTGGDYVLTIGFAGSLANGTRLALAWFRPDGQLATERLANGRQILDVMWTGNSQLSLSRATGVHGQVGPLFLNRFYVLGRLDLTATADGDSDFVVLCLHDNGSLFEPCPGFGTLGNGMVRVAFDVGGAGFRQDLPHDLHIDLANEKLLLAGAAQLSGGSPPGSDYDFAVARLHLYSGALDTSFNGTGRRTIHFDLSAASFDTATSIHVRPLDGKIVVAGLADTGPSGGRSAMAQLNSDGSLDGGFCAPAVASCDSPPSHRSGRRLWNDEQGVASAASAVLGGDPGSSDTVVVARRAVAGTDIYGVVSRVAVDGGCTQCAVAWLSHLPVNIPVVATTDLQSAAPGVANPGIVVASWGWWHDSEIRRTLVSRIRYADMTLDDRFVSGVNDTLQSYDFPTASGQTPVSLPTAMTVDSRGRYLIAGWHRWHQANNDWDFALARLQNDIIFDHGLEY